MSQSLRLVLLYVVVGICWIILSDELAARLFEASPRSLAEVSMLKGLAFVAATGLGLYLILRSEFRRREERETAARSAELQFRRLFAENPVPMWIYDTDTLRFLDVNEAAVALYGYSRDEFLSMRISDIRPPEDVERLKHTVGDASRFLKPPTLWRHIYKNGDLRYVHIVGNRVTYEGQTGVLVAVHDVTNSHLLQQELLALNRRLELIINSSPVPIVAADVDGIVSIWNAAAEQTFGWTAEEAIGQPLPYIPPDADLEAAEIRRRVIGGETLPALQLRRMRKDGALIDVRVAIAPIFGSEGQVVGQFGMLVDVTAEHQAVQRTAELASIVEASDDAIIGKTLDGIITSWNRGAEAMYGYSAEEMIGSPIARLIPPEKQGEIVELLETVQRGESIRQRETVRVRRDGQPLTVSLSIFPIFKDGQPVAAAAIARDITERKQAEQQLAYQANLLQNVSDAIIALDAGWHVQSWNRGAEIMYGWTADEVVGKPIGPLLEPEYSDTTPDAILEEFLRTGEVTSEAMHVRKDGTRIRIMNSTTAIRDAKGNLIGAVGINRDVTRQRELEAEARESERLRDALQREIEARALRNRFVSMVSHEFRTPLAVIQSATDVLQHYDARLSPEDKQRHFRQIQQQLDELIELLNEFLVLSRMETVGVQFEPEETDVVAVCQEIVEAARASWSTHPIELISDGTCPVARLDRKLFQQAVRNIVGNAVKYSPEGAPITIRVTCQQGELIVEVRDRGIGIPEAEQARLFEPFFRASNVGNVEGTGLGLAIVQRAIEAHRGTVRISSRVGMGSAVTFVLPQEPLEPGA